MSMNRMNKAFALIFLGFSCVANADPGPYTAQLRCFQEVSGTTGSVFPGFFMVTGRRGEQEGFWLFTTERAVFEPFTQDLRGALGVTEMRRVIVAGQDPQYIQAYSSEGSLLSGGYWPLTPDQRAACDGHHVVCDPESDLSVVRDFVFDAAVSTPLAEGSTILNAELVSGLVRNLQSFEHIVSMLHRDDSGWFRAPTLNLAERAESACRSVDSIEVRKALDSYVGALRAYAEAP